MNTIPNRQVICDVLIEFGKKDRDVIVLCSDSRGSASLAAFAKELPEQFIEVGIAEQNLVSVAAGLASCGKKPFAASPACFLSTRSMEQVKVDVAYSNTNVKLIGISGGVSYGALGMTHHSTQDIAAIASIPGMRVYLPSDRFQTRALFEAVINDDKPAYIRVGRNAVADVYEQDDSPFLLDKATMVRDGKDITIIACGEMVSAAKIAGKNLSEQGISARVLDMYCVKPIDVDSIVRAAKETKAIITIEEHGPIGGIGSMVSQIVGSVAPVIVRNMTLPDTPVITGKSQEVFDYYGLNEKGIVSIALELTAHV
jgi:transketolase